MLNSNTKFFYIPNTNILDELFEAYTKHLLDEHSLEFSRTNKLKYKFARLLGAENYDSLVSMVNKGVYAHHNINAACSAVKATSNESRTCHRCGSDLDEMGWCSDTACIYERWTQDAEFNDQNSYSSKTGSRRVRITAVISSDDGNYEAEFDAAPYINALVEFELNGTSTVDKGIYAAYKEMLAIDFNGGEATDEIAQYFEGYEGVNPEAKEIAYLFETNKFSGGYSVSVNQEELIDWLTNHDEVIATKCKQIETAERHSKVARKIMKTCDPEYHEYLEVAVKLLSDNGYEVDEYNPHSVSAWIIQHDAGTVVSMGSYEQEALDYAVDNNLLDSQKMSDEDFQEYSQNGWCDSYITAGNAGEPFWSENMIVTKLFTA